MKIFIILVLFFFSCIPLSKLPDDPNTKEGFLKHFLINLLLNKPKEYLLATNTKYIYIIDSESDEIKKVVEIGEYPSFKNPSKLNQNLTPKIALIKADEANNQWQLRYLNLVNLDVETIAVFPDMTSDVLLSFDEFSESLNTIHKTTLSVDLYVYPQKEPTVKFFPSIDCPVGADLTSGNYWDFSFSNTKYFFGNRMFSPYPKFCGYEKNDSFSLNLIFSVDTFDYYHTLRFFSYNAFYDKAFLFAVNTSTLKMEIRNPSDGSICNTIVYIMNSPKIKSLIFQSKYKLLYSDSRRLCFRSI